MTGAPYSVNVKGAKSCFKMRQTGSMMMLKSLCAGDREFLMTGISPLGWIKAFRIKDFFLVDSAHELGYPFCSYGTTTHLI